MQRAGEHVCKYQISVCVGVGVGVGVWMGVGVGGGNILRWNYLDEYF